jgi:hypothetical protein
MYLPPPPHNAPSTFATPPPLVYRDKTAFSPSDEPQQPHTSSHPPPHLALPIHV